MSHIQIPKGCKVDLVAYSGLDWAPVTALLSSPFGPVEGFGETGEEAIQAALLEVREVSRRRVEALDALDD